VLVFFNDILVYSPNYHTHFVHLQEVWYVHFASLFCIIICCYSLIYFTFRDDTYVVSSIFTCLMIIGGFATRVRILLEKRPSRHYISEDREIPEKYQKIIFYQKTDVARRRREEPQGGHTTRGRTPTPGRAGLWCGHPGPLLPSPLHVFHRPRKPKLRGAQR
jgi:hypothetical protein